MINPLDHPVFLSRPLRRVKPYWWLPHVPFAMFIVDLVRPKLLVELGTHTGTSYSAFCQAVLELSLDTHCYAVDTWQGDPHEGYYGGEVFQELRAFHDPLFGRFSDLIRTTFDDAATHFNDQSIDLLHIDGYHTYEAVRHDFETWLPKMSPRGLILLHDTSVRREDFGVWRYWEELRQRYPALEFQHGQGLGIVFVGSEMADNTAQLFSMSEDQLATFRDLFFKFGSKESDLLEHEDQLQALASEVAQQARLVGSLREQAARSEQQVAQTEQQLAQNEQLVRSLREQLAQSQELLSTVRSQLSEITISRAWKLARLSRGMEAFLVPPGSRRARLAGALLRFVLVPIRKLRTARRLRDESVLLGSGLFDADWYLGHNPDVAEAKIDPLRHYLLHGGFEGRDPSPNFSSAWYLNTYDDVKRAGINPLVHYVRYGWNEQRRTSPHTAMEATGPESIPEEVTPFPPDLISSSKELVQRIERERRSEQYVISISHDDYLTVNGGVQSVVGNQQRVMNAASAGYLHIYPYTSRDTLADDDGSLLMAVSFDGQRLGVIELNQLLEALRQMESMQVANVHIHHAMGMSIAGIDKLLALSNHRGKFWLHDYFSLCPSKHLLRNDVTFCAAPAITSNACAVCRYGDARERQQPQFIDLFNRNELEVIAPSEFTLAFWRKKSPLQPVGERVLPPAVLKEFGKGPARDRNGELHIAFLGYPLDHKGWQTWLRIVGLFGGQRDYRFYHFSSSRGTPGNYRWIETRVTASTPNAMVDALEHASIDVALLWSQTAETFSITLHEALAAGCFILTNEISGNIQYYLRHNPRRGRVLAGEQALIDLLDGNGLEAIIAEYQKDGVPQALLIRADAKE